jgi:hypothetical protein
MTWKYPFPELPFSEVKTYPLTDRKNLVRQDNVVDLSRWETSRALWDLIPNTLKGKELKFLVEAILKAQEKKKPVIFGLGAHVIKCGLSPIIIDLMKRGFVQGIAMTGAGAIHDYELSFIGETSEDVAQVLQEGEFGFAEETGRMMNEALKKYIGDKVGMGEALGRDISQQNFTYKHLSILATGFTLNLPVTVHLAIGTDIINLHPATDPALLGQATYNDFQLFASLVAQLGDGGCYLNIGSAVILPEVFLKAVSISNNLGYLKQGFTTANLDMIQHYRPLTNVVNRPTKSQGKGYYLTGHHEILIPLLYYLLVAHPKITNDAEKE